MSADLRRPSLFDADVEVSSGERSPGAADSPVRPDAPLAERMRPRTLPEIVGQEALLADGEPLREAILGGELFSMILWGPPGSGKTTLANAIRRGTQMPYEALSAVLTGVKELREVLTSAAHRRT